MTDKMSCYHCGLSVNGQTYYVTIFGESRAMCCLGCQAVAEAIVEQGLEQFYEFRGSELNNKTDELVPSQLQFSHYDQSDIQSSYLLSGTRLDSDAKKEMILTLEGITCPACIWLLEKRVSQIRGVIEFSVNLTSHRAQLIWDDHIISLSTIMYDIAKIGFKPHPYKLADFEVLDVEKNKTSLKRLAVSGLGFGQVMMFSAPLYDWFSYPMPAHYRDFFRVVSLIVTTPVLFYCGWPFFKSAWNGLRANYLTMDVSIAFALLAVYFAGIYATIIQSGQVYFDSITMFVFFITLSRFLESKASSYSHYIAQSLGKYQKEWVVRIRDQCEESVLISQLNKGDVISIKAGESIPIDGLVLAGESAVSEALLTGESTPKTKSEHDMVYAGSLNIDHPLTLRVEKMGDQTVLSTIVTLFERAQFTKPVLVTLTQKAAHYFILIQLLLAFIMFAWWLQASLDQAIWVSISLLVVTCPCALAIATPIAITTAMHALSKKGILCSKGDALESLASVTDIVFDKTGTLTEGQFSISAIHNFSSYNNDDLLFIAASLESQSEHPIASAFQHYAGKANLIAKNVKIHTNNGLEGMIKGEHYYIGKKSFIQSYFKNPIPNHCLTSNATHIYLASDQALLGVIELQDRIRIGAKAIISSLEQLGYQMHILSGDADSNVNACAHTLEIETWRGSCTPQDKLDYVASLQGMGKRVVMIGDGMNDAPVLQQADVSIAMASAADLTRVNADAILLNNSIDAILILILHAKKSNRIIKQCLFWALIYNIIAVPMAMGGLVAPYIAAGLMSMSSIFVVLNALRLINVNTVVTKRADADYQLSLQEG